MELKNKLGLEGLEFQHEEEWQKSMVQPEIRVSQIDEYRRIAFFTIWFSLMIDQQLTKSTGSETN